MATIGGARALGLADEIGSLEPGKAADLVLFPEHSPSLANIHDPYQKLVYCASARDVAQVRVAGAPVAADGRVLGVDVGALLPRARELAVKLATDAGLDSALGRRSECVGERGGGGAGRGGGPPTSPPCPACFRDAGLAGDGSLRWCSSSVGRSCSSSRSLQNATVKASGAEVTLTARAEAAVVAATVDKSGPGPTQPDDIERAIRSTRAATGALPASGLLGRVALWVDDEPDNNRHERAALAALGLGHHRLHVVGSGAEPARHPDVRRRDLRHEPAGGAARGAGPARGDPEERQPTRSPTSSTPATASASNVGGAKEPWRLRLHRGPEHAPPARRRGGGAAHRADHRQECGVAAARLARTSDHRRRKARHDQAGETARTRPPDHDRPEPPRAGRGHRRRRGRRRDTRDALRRLREASYPAVLYIPRDDVDLAALERTDHTTYCPYKGDAAYYSIPGVGERGANSSSGPTRRRTRRSPSSRTTSAFYPDRVDGIDEQPL